MEVEKMLSILQRLVSEETGQGMVEYGLILALIAVAVIAVLTTMGDELQNMFTNIKDTISDNSSTGGGS